MFAHRLMVVAAVLGFGAVTLLGAHEAASAAVTLGSMMVYR
ncbi:MULTISPECIES: hypothetical protein [unclassified Sphingomonas]|nr:MULTISPECIES: hypothetical protein [unclassified Sphingomonas]